MNLHADGHIAGIGKSEIWAITLSEDGRFLAGTTHDGHIKVWDLLANCAQIRDFETKGSFGVCIDWVGQARLVMSINTNGNFLVC
jgi:superkiller protein 8